MAKHTAPRPARATTVINMRSLPTALKRALIRAGNLGRYVYIGRPGRYGNPFVIGQEGDRKEVIKLYRSYLKDNIILQRDILQNLKEKTLVCYCKPEACHGDVIIEFLEEYKGRKE